MIVLMHSRKKLLITTAIIEIGTGLSLMCLPTLVIWLLIGVQKPSHEALIVSRVAGAGLLAIGIACWLASDDSGSPSQDGLLWGILIYNVGACTILTLAGSMIPMVGIALWPASVIHALMTIWCAVNLRTNPPTNK